MPGKQARAEPVGAGELHYQLAQIPGGTLLIEHAVPEDCRVWFEQADSPGSGPLPDEQDRLNPVAETRDGIEEIFQVIDPSHPAFVFLEGKRHFDHFSVFLLNHATYLPTPSRSPARGSHPSPSARVMSAHKYFGSPSRVSPLKAAFAPPPNPSATMPRISLTGTPVPLPPFTTSPVFS